MALKILARNIDVFLARQGWSPMDLAFKMNVSIHVLNRIRKRKVKSVEFDTLDSLASATHTPVYQWFTPIEGINYNA